MNKSQNLLVDGVKMNKNQNLQVEKAGDNQLIIINLQVVVGVKMQVLEINLALQSKK